MALLYLVLALSSGSLPERARRRDVCSQSEARARGQWLLLRGGERDWQASLREAMQSQQEGKLEAAAQAYREAMSLHEPLRSAWPVLTNYGLSIQPSSPAEAAEAFRSAISLIPDGVRQADGYFNLGNALIDVGDVDGYVAAFESCIALAPHDADAHYNLGSALLSSRHPQRALPALHAAASLSPSDGKAHLGLGDCLMRLNRVLEAEASYARARQLRPDHAPTLASSGNCAEERGAMREAEELWKKSLAIAPDDAVYSNLGAMLRRSNRMPESRAAYASALKLNPRSVEAYIGLGKCYRAPAGEAGTPAQRDEFARFLASTYGAALEIAPAHVGAHLAVAEGLAMWGERGKCGALGGKSALDFYAAALMLQPHNTNAATHVVYDAAVEPGGGVGRAAEAEPGGGRVGAVGVEARCEPGAAGSAGEDDASPPPITVEMLSAPVPGAGASDAERAHATAEALRLWRRHGVVVFPGLLTPDEVQPLLRAVRAAEVDPNATDYSQVTRDSSLGARTHKALPVSAARPALDAVAARLGSFLATALGEPNGSLPMLESGFMVTRPGARDQAFHRDVAPGVVSASSLSASVQLALVDTASNQGALQVKPRTHRFDPAAPFVDGVDGGDVAPVALALPEGSVVVYALHLVHRGSANTAAADRLFYFFTLKGRGYAPPGLAYTIEPTDIAKYRLAANGLEQAAAR